MDVAAVTYILTTAQIVFAALAVATALIPLLANKGSATHRRGGQFFVAVNLLALPCGLVLAWLQQAPLLFCFHGFILYLLLSGWRAAQNRPVGVIDAIIPGLLVVIATMVLLATHHASYQQTIFLILFALHAFGLAAHDWRLLQQSQTQQRRWLTRHIGGMLGAVAANISVIAVTFLPNNWHWLWPAVLVLAAGVIAWRQWRRQQTRAILFTPDLRTNP
jgi:hypothetical protein